VVGVRVDLPATEVKRLRNEGMIETQFCLMSGSWKMSRSLKTFSLMHENDTEEREKKMRKVSKN